LVVLLGVGAGRGAKLRSLGARELVSAISTYAEKRLLVILTESKESTTGNGSDSDRSEQDLGGGRAAGGLRRRGRAGCRAAVVTNARANRGSSEAVEVTSGCSQGLSSPETSAKGSHLGTTKTTDVVEDDVVTGKEGGLQRRFRKICRK